MTTAAPPPSHRRRATQPSAPPEPEPGELAADLAQVSRDPGPHRVRHQPPQGPPWQSGTDMAQLDEVSDVGRALGQVSRAGTTRWTDEQRRENNLDSAAARSLSPPPPTVDLGAPDEVLDLDALLRRVPRG